ncbi:MAG: membrane integrity-associated transporter subunit PqiC [Candidatus Binatia bacterium]
MNIPALHRSPRLARATASLVAALMVVTGATGCSILKAAPDHSRYFVLASTATPAVTVGEGSGDAAAPADRAPGRRRPDVHFGLGPIKLPGYLDTQSIVKTDTNGRIEYVRDAYWGEPLADGFARALLYRTGARIGTSHAVAFPWYATMRVDWKVPVDVLRFEATDDGRAVLVARWSIERTSDGRVVAGGQSVLEETGGTDAVLIVDALNRCIDRLADDIATTLTGPAAVAPGASDKGRSPR